MHIFYRSIFVIITIFSSISLFGQEQLGLKIGQYSGVEGIALNPANNLSFPLTWDFNIGSAGFFLGNDVIYISETNVLNLYANYENVKEAIYPDKDVQPRGPLVAHLFNNNRGKYFSLLTRFSGPSLALHIGNNSFGIFTKARFEMNMQNIPGSVTYLGIYNTKFGDPIYFPKTDMAGMAWAEVGVHYGRRIELNDGFLDLGVNLKSLMGYQGFFIKNGADFRMVLSQDSVEISKPDLTFGYTDEALDQSFLDNPTLNKNGSGFSMDIGANYVVQDNTGGYRYKVGVSLIDLGSIKFNKNAQHHQFSIDSFNTDFRKYEEYTDPDAIIEAINQDFYGAIDQSQVSNDFTIQTPAAISIHGDVKIAPLFYLHALWNQRLVFKTPAVKRSNLIAVTPRIEHRWFSLMMPVVIHNYTQFRTGLVVRLAFLTVGTDDVRSILGHGKFTGTDIYVGLKFNPFKLGLSGGNRGKYRGPGTKGVKCYKF